MCFNAPSRTASLSDWLAYRNSLNELESNQLESNERLELEKKKTDKMILVIQLFPNGLNVDNPEFKEVVDFLSKDE